MTMKMMRRTRGTSQSGTTLGSAFAMMASLIQLQGSYSMTTPRVMSTKFTEPLFQGIDGLAVVAGVEDEERLALCRGRPVGVLDVDDRVAEEGPDLGPGADPGGGPRRDDLLRPE